MSLAVSIQRWATYVLIKARIVKVNRVRPGVVIPDVVCENIKPSWEDALLHGGIESATIS